MILYHVYLPSCITHAGYKSGNTFIPYFLFHFDLGAVIQGVHGMQNLTVKSVTREAHVM